MNKIYPRKYWIFIQDGRLSERSHTVRYIKKDQWPPKSPDSHCVKSVRIQSYADKNNSKYGHFLRSEQSFGLLYLK